MIKINSTTLKSICLAAMLGMTSLFVLSGCESDKGYQAPPPPSVTVDKPSKKSVTVWAIYTGNTVPYESVEIRARVEGFLNKITFEPSSRVKQGQLLFEIEPKPYQAQLDQALADLSIQKAELQLADATLVRKENAFKDRAVSEVEVIQARAEKAKAEASIKAAEAAVETAQINLSYTSIHSPIPGMVSRNLVDEGNLVGRGEATLLTTVVNDNPMYAYFNVSETNLLYHLRKKREHTDPRKKLDEPAKVYLALADDEGYPHEGVLDYMDNTVDPQTGTIQVRGKFPNSDGALVSGLFAKIRIPIDTIKDALMVPEAALGADQGGRYLLVVNQKNQVEYRKVKLGPLEGKERAVLEGIKAEDRVIIKGLQRVRAGMTVTPMTPEEEKAQAQAQEAKAKKAKAEKAEAAKKEK
jgi:RND family efflux transporter MFP subunit